MGDLEDFDAWLWAEDNYIPLYFNVIDSTTMQAVANFEEASDARESIRELVLTDKEDETYIPGRYYIDTEVIGS